MIKTISAKLGNMRKAETFVVYPASKTSPLDGGAEHLVIQSDHRIASFDPVSGAGVLSKYRSNGAYFLHLSRVLGAMDITVPADVIAAALDARPKSGDTIGNGVVRIA